MTGQVAPLHAPRRRNRQLLRTLDLLRLLHQGRMTAPELARALKVHVRTIYRDTEALEEANLLQVERVDGEPMRYHRVQP